jgi:hypothetical protein
LSLDDPRDLVERIRLTVSEALETFKMERDSGS